MPHARLLLDTNVLLWVIDAPGRLPPAVLAAISDTDNQVFFSAASIWEIAIKATLQRPDFHLDAAEIALDATATGFVELPVTASVAAQVTTLPMHHRDPFDRLLIAQALALPARLYTSDRLLARYSELVEVFDPV